MLGVFSCHYGGFFFFFFFLVFFFSLFPSCTKRNVYCLFIALDRAFLDSRCNGSFHFISFFFFFYFCCP